MDLKKSAILTASLFTGLSALEAQVPQKPNIILIMTDQQRGDCVGWASSQVKTPNLDAIAREGVCFDHAYSTTPSSTPARAALLTGMSPGITGCWGMGKLRVLINTNCPGC